MLPTTDLISRYRPIRFEWGQICDTVPEELLTRPSDAAAVSETMDELTSEDDSDLDSVDTDE
jgi:hypothetical protein